MTTLLRLICPRCAAALKWTAAVPRNARVKCPRCGSRFSTIAPRAADSDAAPVPDTMVGRVAAVRPLPPPAPSGPGLGDYEVLGELGRGGMGVVYKARHRRLQRLVALKMVLPGPHAGPQEVARLRAEATAVAQLQHPNVVQIYEIGEHDGRPFLALEYIDGPTLAERLAGVPQPPRAAAELLETLARTVHAAHQRGVVHRDLKPANVLLAGPSHEGPACAAEQLYGVPKVADFGLAKRLGSDGGLTGSRAVMGTANYMAPEQAIGRPQEVGPAADVYALGVILYEMLTGRPPLVGGSSLETMRQTVYEEAVPPRRLRPGVPRDLETVCLKCLRKAPSQRYDSAMDLADDLRRFLNGVPVRARPPGPWGGLSRWCKRYPVAAGLLAAAVCCLAFGFWHLSRLADHLVRSAALESAAQQSDLLSEVNDSYSDVVRRAQAGGLTVTHDYEGRPAAIPIPATFTIELGQQISERGGTGARVRLYSDFPFRQRRTGGPKDDFERAALARLRADPAAPVWRFEDYQGRPSLRYATARRMQQTCVDCHNSHPDSPKTDWQVGDVRGVVEIIRPLDRDVARTRDGLWTAAAFIGAVCATLLGLAGVVLLTGRPRGGKA